MPEEPVLDDAEGDVDVADSAAHSVRRPSVHGYGPYPSAYKHPIKTGGRRRVQHGFSIGNADSRASPLKPAWSSNLKIVQATWHDAHHSFFPIDGLMSTLMRCLMCKKMGVIQQRIICYEMVAPILARPRHFTAVNRQFHGPYPSQLGRLMAVTRTRTVLIPTVGWVVLAGGDRRLSSSFSYQWPSQVSLSNELGSPETHADVVQLIHHGNLAENPKYHWNNCCHDYAGLRRSMPIAIKACAHAAHLSTLPTLLIRSTAANVQNLSWDEGPAECEAGKLICWIPHHSLQTSPKRGETNLAISGHIWVVSTKVWHRWSRLVCSEWTKSSTYATHTNIKVKGIKYIGSATTDILRKGVGSWIYSLGDGCHLEGGRSAVGGNGRNVRFSRAVTSGFDWVLALGIDDLPPSFGVNLKNKEPVRGLQLWKKKLQVSTSRCVANWLLASFFLAVESSELLGMVLKRSERHSLEELRPGAPREGRTCCLGLCWRTERWGHGVKSWGAPWWLEDESIVERWRGSGGESDDGSRRQEAVDQSHAKL
ncbi:hypothetical protein FB45DRAFT_1007382 [Roridomyces roridus]|uniref:Uncharacterized protein n=1 Tax=Roridomyces roridus TaxID=1738132 RepID=A0AAD7FE60_9AGAR|nr:hypothetical protein FB45DRAFT_1007382 [Roridomyces roridus]